MVDLSCLNLALHIKLNKVYFRNMLHRELANQMIRKEDSGLRALGLDLSLIVLALGINLMGPFPLICKE